MFIGISLALNRGGSSLPALDPPSNLQGTDLGGGSGDSTLSFTDASAAPNGYEFELYSNSGPTQINGTLATGFGSSPVLGPTSGFGGDHYYRMRTLGDGISNQSSEWVQSPLFTIVI